MSRILTTLSDMTDRPARRTSAALSSAAAAALRMDGMPYKAIAEYLDIPIPTVKKDIERYLAAVAEQTKPETRDTLRRREDARLDAMLYGVWSKALDKQHPEHLQAVRAALAIADRRAKLHGLDAPTEVVVHNPTTSEIDAWVAGIVSRATNHGVQEADIIDGEIVEDDSPPALEA